MMLLGNINAIPFRRRFGGGGGTPFPYIPGMIARYSGAGLTNEDMSANPVWKDLTGNGHDLQMKNFAWSGMSGVGGYVQNFNTWVKSASRIDATVIGSSVFKINAIRQSRIIQLYYQSEGSQQPFTIPAFVIKVSGLIDNQKLRYQHYKDGVTAYFEINVDGIYNLPSFDFLAGGSVYGFIFDKIQESCDITIEILPLYPGALVFDGVDDYGTCDNFPILTKEKGYTVVALRQYLVEESTAYLTANGDSISNTSFIFEGNNYKDTWNFGRATTIQASRILATQTSKQYDGVKLNIGSNTEGSNLLQVGKWSKSYSNVAIWELVYLDHDATEEELTKIKDYFVKTYPWLFPDQAWTVTGKTNEDEDRATIANITGNGNDLVLSNFGFAEGSGYGLYKLNFNNWFANSGSGNVNMVNVVNPHKIVLEQSQEAVGAFFLGKNVSYSGELKISVSNKPSDIELSFGSTALGKVILNEGINIVKINPVNTSIGFFTNKAFEAQNIIIEQIPEYEGYLVTDGVDDKAVSKQFKFGENFTVILDFKFPVKKISYCGFDLSAKVRIQNLQDSGVYVVLKGNKTLIPSNVVRAVTSEGKVYDENWNEYNIVPGNIPSNYTMVNLGFDGSNQFAESATKLAGIYSSTLSKDDCIKAYNYLQTLKAK